MAGNDPLRRGAFWAWAVVAIYFAAMLALAVESARRDAAVPEVELAESVRVGDNSRYYLDFGSIRDPSDLLKPETEALFRPSGGQVPSVGMRHFDGGSLWLRFTVPRLETSETDWTIRIHDERAREARLIWFDSGEPRELRWDYKSPERRSRLSSVEPAFHLPRQQMEGQEFFLNFTSYGALRGHVYVETRRAFETDQLVQAIVASAIAGFMLALAIYLLVFGFFLREQPLIYAAGMSVFVALLVFGGEGFVHALLLPGHQLLADLLVYATQPVGISLWLLFVVAWLQLRQVKPWFGWALTWLALVLPFQGVIISIEQGLGIDIVPTHVTAALPSMAGMLAGLGALLWLAIAGSRKALYFLICWLPLAVGTFWRAYVYLVPSARSESQIAFDVSFDLPASMLALAILLVVELQSREAALLRRAEANARRFSDYAGIASDSFFETAPDGTILSASGPAAAELGLQPHGPLAAQLARRIDEEARALVAALESGEQGGFRSLEASVRRANGDRGWLSFSATPWRDVDGSFGGLRGTIVDVTERVERGDALARQGTLAALGRLAGGVAHEVNNLLHPMINLARRAGDRYIADPEGKRLIDLVVQSGEQAGRIVASVLTAFNPGRSAGPAVPLHKAVADAVDTCAALAPQSVKLRLSSSETPHHLVESGEMLQVLSNLVSNSVRASNGRGAISIRLETGPGGAARLIVQDDGPGMPPELLARATDPFVSGRQGGTGLGLSVVATIVQKWDARLDIASAPGEGVRVTIDFPAGAAGEGSAT